MVYKQGWKIFIFALSDYNLPRILFENFRLKISFEGKVDIPVMILLVIGAKRNNNISLLTIKITLEYMRVFFAS